MRVRVWKRAKTAELVDRVFAVVGTEPEIETDEYGNVKSITITPGSGGGVAMRIETDYSGMRICFPSDPPREDAP